MPTKDELEQENAELREQLAEARAAAAPTTAAAAGPAYPTDDNGNRVLSAGEANDLAQFGVTRSPFDGKTLNALDEDVEPANPEARTRAERDQAERERPSEDTPNEWPISGAPPAAGGDAEIGNVRTGR